MGRELTNEHVSTILNKVLLVRKMNKKSKESVWKKYKKTLKKVKKTLAILWTFLYNKKAVTR